MNHFVASLSHTQQTKLMWLISLGSNVGYCCGINSVNLLFMPAVWLNLVEIIKKMKEKVNYDN